MLSLVLVIEMTDLQPRSRRKRTVNGGVLGVLRGSSQPIHYSEPSERSSFASMMRDRLNTSAYVFEPKVEMFRKKQKRAKPKPLPEFSYKPSPVEMPRKRVGDTEFAAKWIGQQAEEIVALNSDLFPDHPLMPEDILNALPSPLREEELPSLNFTWEDYSLVNQPLPTRSRIKASSRALRDILHYKVVDRPINVKAFKERRYASLIHDPRSNEFEKFPGLTKKYNPADLPQFRKRRGSKVNSL
jgi:hypothetical protein